jgi:hypothetical protein
MPIIDPSTVSNKNDVLAFTMADTDKSIVNALRRTIIGSIPAVVMRPENCKISVNTTRFNNEILKQRLACIPVYIHPDKDIETYTIHLKKSNITSTVMYVTSEDFEVRVNGKKTEAALFPPNETTKTYIDILRLRPKMELAIESIELTATLSVATGNQSGTFNLANCSFTCSVNEVEAENKWSKTGNTNKDEYMDWKLLDAKRCVLPNSYDVKVESIAVYSNEQIVKIACLLLQKELLIYKDLELNIKASESTMPHCVDIVFDNCDYTIGKLLEYNLFSSLFPKKITYISFIKIHPHDLSGILRIAFTEDPSQQFIHKVFVDACKECIDYYNFSSVFK